MTMSLPQAVTPSVKLITRHHLFELLEEHLGLPLMVIRAPAGYGKTALIEDWLCHHPHPSDWIRCSSQPMAEVLENQIAEIEQRLACQKPESATPKNRFILVLDDFEQLQDPTALEWVSRIIIDRHLPVTLVLLTRRPPALNIARLRMADEVLELSESDLQFSADEVHELLQARLPYLVSRDQSERLCRRVRGWPSAVQMAIFTSRTPTQLEAYVSHIDKGHRYLNEFFEEEVIHDLPQEEVQFLQAISPLKQFNGELVHTVTGNANARLLLYKLEKKGIFISPKDDFSNWYEFHPLFSQYLYHRLLTFEGNRYIELHQRASDALRDMDKAEMATEHAIAARDTERLTALLNRYGRQFYYTGQLSLLERSYCYIPETVVSGSPILTLLQAWVAQNQYEYEKVHRSLNKAEKNLRHLLPVVEWASLESEISAIRAQVAMNQGQTDKALKLAESALKHDHIHLHSCLLVAHSVLGEAHFVQGRLKEASEEIRHTELLARAEDAQQLVIWCLCLESEIAIAQGLLQKSWNLQEKAIQYADQHQLHDLPLLEFVYRIRANLLLEWHHLEDAELFALKGLEALEHQHERWDLQALVILAKVALEQGNLGICQKYIDRIQNLLDTEEYHLDWIANASSVLVSYWIENQDREKLVLWLQQCRPSLTHTNHFTQCNSRNQVRALISLEEYEKAQQLLDKMRLDAEQHHLIMELNRLQILQVKLCWQTGQKHEALTQLSEALEAASSTGAITSFLKLDSFLLPMFEALITKDQLSELAKQRANRLISLVRQKEKFNQVATLKLDESVIQDIINRPDVPELIRLSPLTRREWQVLSLIHGGLSNEQIAAQLNVAPTTIKTHIRSLYQKLNISHRSEAISLAKELLEKIND